MTWSPQSDGTSDPASPPTGGPTSGATPPPGPSTPAPGPMPTPSEYAPPPSWAAPAEPAPQPPSAASYPPVDPYAQAEAYPGGGAYPPGTYAPGTYPPGTYPPGGYAAGYPYQPAPSRGTNTMAILALVLAFVFAPAAIVLGHMAKRQIKTSGEEGGALATAGLVLGYLFTGLFALACCGAVASSIIAANSGVN